MLWVFDLVFFDIFLALNIVLFKLTFSSHHLFIEKGVFLVFILLRFLHFLTIS
ncbi:putative membrane protein [Escherichia coli DEC2E]|nr:putative membrane protein [Escherichia coli DEC2E]